MFAYQYFMIGFIGTHFYEPYYFYGDATLNENTDMHGLTMGIPSEKCVFS
jgi:hypothetical protein